MAGRLPHVPARPLAALFAPMRIRILHSASPYNRRDFRYHPAMSSDHPDFGGPIVWRPTPELIANSNLKRFMDRHGIKTYDELMRRSTDDFAWFWDDVLKNELKIRFDKPFEKIVD